MDIAADRPRRDTRDSRPRRVSARRLEVMVLGVLLATAPGGGAANAAVPLEDDSSEAQLMGYYAAALQFTAAGAPGGDRVEAGVDFTYLPSLTEEDRQTTFAGSKVENTNIYSVLPRPRLRWRPRPDWLLETGFVPDVQVKGVSPQQVAAAATWRFAGEDAGTSWRVRAHYLIAEIVGPFTCSEDAVEDEENIVCLGGQPSEDHFSPEIMGVDILVDGPRLFAENLAWYAGAGYRHENLHFETHFVNAFGRLDDQEIVARLDRGSVFGGVTWAAWRGLKVSGEAYWAPGALATARACITWGWGGAP